MGKAMKEFHQESGFIVYNHFQLENVVDGKSSIMKVVLSEDSMNPYGFAHGGLIFGLADTAMGVIAKSTGRSAVTLSSNISYLKPSTGKFLVVKGEMIKNGKTTCYLRANIYNDKEELVATCDGNYYYVD